MDSPGLGLSLLGLLAVIALVLTNAYFVATEFALVAVRRTQVKLWVKEGRRPFAQGSRRPNPGANQTGHSSTAHDGKSPRERN